jgi:hypothetical protein
MTTQKDNKDIVKYPTRQEKLAHLARLTVDELSKTKRPKVKRVLVNQLQFFRRFWEREQEDK